MNNVINIESGSSISPDVQTKPQSTDLTVKAATLRITNSIEYIQACEDKLAIDQFIADRKANHDPVVKSAFETHRKACEARAADIDPLEAAKKIYAREIDRWRQEQERIALEQARLENERQNALMLEQREAEIVEAEKADATVEEVEAIIERPVYTPPVVVPKTPPSLPKVAGIRKRSENWKAKLDPAMPPIEAMKKLVAFISTNPQFITLIQVNESSASALAKGMKTAMVIPGLVAYNENAL